MDKIKNLLLNKCVLFTALILFFIYHIIFIPLPKPVIRILIEYSSEWVFSDRQSSPSGIEGAMQKLVGETLQQSLVAHFHSLGPEYQKGQDAAFAAVQLRRLRPMLINQSELKHNPKNGPVALTGLAWCDIANGLAGRLLAHDFDDVQIVGVRSAENGVGHSFGRFWSTQYGDWLYFDIWPEEVFVFLALEGGGIKYLHQSAPLANGVKWPLDVTAAKKFHAMIGQSFVHNELQPNVASYFFNRIANLLMHGSTAPASATAVLTTVSEGAVIEFPQRAAFASDSTINVYARARAEHFLGNHDLASKLYSEAALRDSGRSVFGTAAQIFVKRLNN